MERSYQLTPFNKYCKTSDGKEAFVGCTAIAVGQIMYHWGYTVSYGGIIFNWANMQLIKNDRDVSGYPQSMELVAKLLRYLGLGTNLNMTYGSVVDNVRSSASSGNAPRTVRNFSYSDGGVLQAYDFNKITNALRENRPVYGRGNSHKEGTSYFNGHAWVYDQFLIRRRFCYWYNYNAYSHTTSDYQQLLHINWGWNGSDDGYYASMRFDTRFGAGPVATKVREGDSGYFRYNLEIIPNIIR